jgi:hypothetical protein
MNASVGTRFSAGGLTGIGSEVGFHSLKLGGVYFPGGSDECRATDFGEKPSVFGDLPKASDVRDDLWKDDGFALGRAREEIRSKFWQSDRDERPGFFIGFAIDLMKCRLDSC